jgi:hypothetical protein
VRPNGSSRGEKRRSTRLCAGTCTCRCLLHLHRALCRLITCRGTRQTRRTTRRTQPAPRATPGRVGANRANSDTRRASSMAYARSSGAGITGWATIRGASGAWPGTPDSEKRLPGGAPPLTTPPCGPGVMVARSSAPCATALSGWSAHRQVNRWAARTRLVQGLLSCGMRPPCRALGHGVRAIKWSPAPTRHTPGVRVRSVDEPQARRL